MGYPVQIATTTVPIVFGPVVLSSDHLSGGTGLSLTVTISKSGGSFASPSGAVTEVGNGFYQIAGNATDNGTLGPLTVNAAATGTSDVFSDLFPVVGYNPWDSAALGLSAMPLKFAQTLPTAPVANTVGEALFMADVTRGRINTAQAGTSTTITLDAGASSVANSYVGDEIFLYGGTGGGLPGTGQLRTIVAYNTSTKVATVDRAWTTTPDNTSTFITMPQAVANVMMWNLAQIATPATAGVPDVNAKNIGNQAAALDTNNLLKVALTDIINTALSETSAGYLAAAFKLLFNVASPALTAASVNQTGDVNALATNGTYGLSALQALLANGTYGLSALQAILANGSYGLSALQTLINNLNNLSALANLFAPSTLVRPSSGSIAYPITLAIHNEEGGKVDLDSNAVTLTAANAAGTDRSANLSSVTHSGTGEYTFTYTVQSSATDEGLSITAAGTVSSSARKAYAACTVEDADSLSSLAAIEAQTNLLAFDGNGNLNANVVDWKGSAAPALTGDPYAATETLITTVGPAGVGLTAVASATNLSTLQTTANTISTNVTTANTNLNTLTSNGSISLSTITGAITSLASAVTGIVNAIGAFGASGANTIKGYLLAMMRSDATLPSDVGGTYTPTADSLQAIRVEGDGAWVTGSGGGGSGANAVTIAVTDASSNPLQNATVRFTSGASSYVQTTNVSGICSFSLNNATWTVSITCSGYSFAPTTLAVSGTTSHTYQMSLIVISPSPGTLAQVTGYTYVYTNSGTIAAGVTVSLTLVKAPGNLPGLVIDGLAVTETSDNTGLVQWTGLFNGATYQLSSDPGSAAKDLNVNIPASGSAPVQFPPLIGWGP